MKREQMIFDLIKQELDFLISYPDKINLTTEWLIKHNPNDLNDTQLEQLWQLKIGE